MSSEAPEPTDRKLDLDSLKALSHPLRVEIFDILSVHGAATASSLAERLGESSGATSYHLRQLARHGFVREVEGRGTARERWWERVPGGVMLDVPEAASSASAQAVTRSLLRQWEQRRGQLLDEFVERGYDTFPEWIEPSVLSTANLRLTKEQLAEVTESWEAWTKSVLMPLRGRSDPGSRPVQIHFNAFPIVGGAVTPDDSAHGPDMSVADPTVTT